MKFIRLVILFVAMIYTSDVFSHNIDEIRKTFQLAIENARITEKLSADLKKIPNPDPLTLAYIASVEALKAKHAWNPFTKHEYMKSFGKMMNDAVKRMPENMEIRYLRYNIQYNVPSYLGYSPNLQEDKKYIIELFLNKKFVTTNKNLITEVYTFMVKSKSVTSDEKLKMEKVLRSL